MSQTTDNNSDSSLIVGLADPGTKIRPNVGLADPGTKIRLIVGLADPGTKIRLIVGLADPGTKIRPNVGLADPGTKIRPNVGLADPGTKIRPNVGLADPGTKIRLIVGLGNPGREYNGTRHNIGFSVLDVLAERHGSQFSFESKWNADMAKIPAASAAEPDVLLMKPRTFMNLSGTAVAAYARFFHLAASQTLVVLDDVALPLGKLRFKSGGSAGGQRGLESILTHFSTQEVPRLRIGVSFLQGEEPAFSKPLSQFVLSRFAAAELPQVESSIKRAADALEYLQREGLDRTMNFYNA